MHILSLTDFVIITKSITVGLAQAKALLASTGL
jgi:hypothetical protein